MRFVILSFAFLGWAFWELSGGANFEPRGLRPAKSETIAKAPAPKAEPLVDVSPVELVAISAIKPRQVAKPQPAAATEETTELTREEKLAQLAQARAGFTDRLSLFPSTSEQTIVLTKLEQGASGFETTTASTDLADIEPQSEYTSPPPDLREVVGTRVNMRDGPGTIHPVVARLNIGHQVEVLAESGTGWLRLRVLPEQHVGWIAASLISKKAR